MPGKVLRSLQIARKSIPESVNGKEKYSGVCIFAKKSIPESVNCKEKYSGVCELQGKVFRSLYFCKDKYSEVCSLFFFLHIYISLFSLLYLSFRIALPQKIQKCLICSSHTQRQNTILTHWPSSEFQDLLGGTRCDFWNLREKCCATVESRASEAGFLADKSSF